MEEGNFGVTRIARIDGQLLGRDPRISMTGHLLEETTEVSPEIMTETTGYFFFLFLLFMHHPIRLIVTLSADPLSFSSVF